MGLSTSPNCLIVGAGGTIGSALLQSLQSSSISIYGTTHKKECVNDNIFYLNLSESSDQWQLPKITFDTAWICAGITRMQCCEENPALTKAVNVTATIQFMEQLKERGTFIVYLSSNQVFSGDKPFVPIDSPHSPQNEYGRQKAAVESWLNQSCPYSAIVRLTKVITPDLPLIANWIKNLKENKPIQAYTDMMLAPISLERVVRGLTIIGEKKQPGCYHLSGAEDISYYDFAIKLASQYQFDINCVKPVSALHAGIKKNFLPRFTTLDCSSTMTFCDKKPHQY